MKDRQTERQAGRQTFRQTDTQTDRERVQNWETRGEIKKREGNIKRRAAEGRGQRDTEKKEDIDGDGGVVGNGEWGGEA